MKNHEAFVYSHTAGKKEGLYAAALALRLDLDLLPLAPTMPQLSNRGVIYCFGGDGTAFGAMHALASANHDDSRPPLFVPLSGGSENVLARFTGLERRRGEKLPGYLSRIVGMVLSRTDGSTSLTFRPSALSYDNRYFPFYWTAGTGVSAEILAEIERGRQGGMGSKTRRAYALPSIARLVMENRFASVYDENLAITALGIDVVAAQLPFFTRRIDLRRYLPHEGASDMILLTIGQKDMYDLMGPFLFTLRTYFDLACMMLGQKPLFGLVSVRRLPTDATIGMETAGKMNRDSVVYNYVNGRVEILPPEMAVNYIGGMKNVAIFCHPSSELK